MKIKLADIKNIELCYENCEVDTIEEKNLLGFKIYRKTKSPYDYKGKQTYRIKTFEIALKDTDYRLRRDLAQLTVNYKNGEHDHFFIVWGDDDCTYDISSLQKVHKNGMTTALTSNCEPTFLM